MSFFMQDPPRAEIGTQLEARLYLVALRRTTGGRITKADDAASSSHRRPQQAIAAMRRWTMNTCACGSAVLRHALVATLIGASWAVPASGAFHVWEKQELTFTSAGSFAHHYMDGRI